MASETIKMAKGKRKKTIWFFGSPSHGNLGDHMIAEASLSFFQKRYPGYTVKEIPRNGTIAALPDVSNAIGQDDLIFYIGGGNLGNYWPENERVRQEVIRWFPGHKKIILPQSIQFTQDDAGGSALERAQEIYAGQNLLLICRGKASLGFARQYLSCPSVLAPDMVMGSRVPLHWKTHGRRSGTVLCLRNDREKALTESETARVKNMLADALGPASVKKTDMVRPYAVPPEKRRAELAAQYKLFSGAEAVITDRLHCMIFCAQTGTPCVVFPNDHHKITECHEWIADLPYIRLIRDVSDLPEALSQVRGTVDREYPLRRMRSYFPEI